MREDDLDRLDQWILDLTFGKRALLAAAIGLAVSIVNFGVQLWLGPVDPNGSR